MKATKFDARIADHLFRVGAAQMQRLEHALGQARLAPRRGETLGAEQRLRRLFQDHCVAGDDGGQHGVDGDEIGIVPSPDHEHDAQRLVANEAIEARLAGRADVVETLPGERDHGATALLETAHFAGRLRRRAAHLPGQLQRDLRAFGDEGVDEAGRDRQPLGERRASPRLLRLGGQGDRRIHLLRRGGGAFGVDAAVHRGDDFQNSGSRFKTPIRSIRNSA